MRKLLMFFMAFASVSFAGLDGHWLAYDPAQTEMIISQETYTLRCRSGRRVISLDRNINVKKLPSKKEWDVYIATHFPRSNSLNGDDKLPDLFIFVHKEGNVLLIVEAKSENNEEINDLDPDMLRTKEATEKYLRSPFSPKESKK